jgi:hypothetical protein
MKASSRWALLTLLSTSIACGAPTDPTPAGATGSAKGNGAGAALARAVPLIATPPNETWRTRLVGNTRGEVRPE